MTIPNHNYLLYKNILESHNKNTSEDKSYCLKLQDALFICREKNVSGPAKEKCNDLDKFIQLIHCYNLYK